jgi:membrane-associated protease RseP (regulator of RpoE activity)
MFLFQELPSTRYDLRFSIGGIPIRIHPLFWLLALLIGSSGDILLLPVWVAAIFVGILVHELGHALAFRRYGQRSRILIHFMGGLTIPEPASWGSGYAGMGMTANQQIFISLAGPLAGFLFAALLLVFVVVTGGSVGVGWLAFLPLPLDITMSFGGRFVTALVSALLWVSIFWGLINLAPVYPLDGGSIARNLFIQLDPVDGVRKSLWISVVAGALIALAFFFLFDSLFMMLLFGVLAFQSYQSLQRRY